MRIRTALRTLLSTAIALALMACIDVAPTSSLSTPHGPGLVSDDGVPAGPIGPGRTDYGSLPYVILITRQVPLGDDIIESLTIGPGGGVIKIKEAGFKLIVPAGAVSENTLFTVTALAGSAVAYEFSPHGATFAEPLRFEQNLRGTDGFVKGLVALNCSYFVHAGLIDHDEGTAVVSEVLPGKVDIVGQRLRCNIDHFSGYLVSAG